MSLQQKKFTARNDGFKCANCGKNVEKSTKSYRNHCPFCLASLHVDINPGDRAESCHGIMNATRLEQKHGEWIIVHKCSVCGKIQNNKKANDDSSEALYNLAKNVEKNRFSF